MIRVFSSLYRNLLRRPGGERGVIIVVVALSMVVLLGFLALALDVGVFYQSRRLMQTAADAGAIAGADELFRGQPASVAVSSAQAATAQNGITNGLNAAVVTVTCPYAGGPCAANSQCVQVTISQPSSTLFGNIFGYTSVSITASAAAGYGFAPSPYCIDALDLSGQDTLLAQSSTINLTKCGIMVNSTGSQALTDQSSKISVTPAPPFGVAVTGGDLIQSGSVTPAPTTGVPPAPNPLADLPAPPYSTACQYNNTVIQSKTTTLNPGVYCGGVTIQSSTVTLNPGTYVGGITLQSSPVTLNPGIYVIKGGSLTAQSSPVSGSGVMFYITGNEALTFQSTGGTLSAPTSGTYNGILFFQDPNDTSQATIQSSSTDLNGVLYFPSATLTVQSSTINGGIVANKILFQSSTVDVNPWSASEQYPLTTVTLVE